MNDKPISFLAYALLGILFALLPAFIGVLRVGGNSGSESKEPSRWILWTVAILALLMAAVVHHPQVHFLIFALPMAVWVCIRTGGKPSLPLLIVVYSAIAVSATMVFWDPIFEDKSLLFMAGGFCLFAAIFELLSNKTMLATPSAFRITEVASLAVFVLLCTFFALTTGLNVNDEILFTTWHHWSAYVGPAELLHSGGRIFYDFPAQYGLGPTVLISLIRTGHYWKGMYYITASANLLYAACIAFISFALFKKKRTPGITIAILALVFVACFIYNAYPPAMATSLICPSTGGLRFLPAALLLSFLVSPYAQPWGMRQKVVGNLFWTLGFFWSPESSFYVTFIWWPYYLWRGSHDEFSHFSTGVLTVCRHFLALLAVTMGVIGVFLAVYRLSYGVFPTVDGVFAYVSNPPGTTVFNFRGPILFVLFSFATAIAAFGIHLRTAAYDSCGNRTLPVLLAVYAVLSYYLGRSEDNNILNVMPFILLMLFAVAAMPEQKFTVCIGRTFIACVVLAAWAFDWPPYWGTAIREHQVFKIDPGSLPKAFSLSNKVSARLIDRREQVRAPLVRCSDAAKASAYIWKTYHERVTMMAPPLVIISSPDGKGWNAYDAPMNFVPLPQAKRRVFLRRTMERLNEPGWLILQIESNEQVAGYGQVLSEDFDAVYDRGPSIKFGSYTAVRYAPRPSVYDSKASVVVGGSRQRTPRPSIDF